MCVQGASVVAFAVTIGKRPTGPHSASVVAAVAVLVIVVSLTLSGAGNCGHGPSAKLFVVLSAELFAIVHFKAAEQVEV